MYPCLQRLPAPVTLPLSFFVRPGFVARGLSWLIVYSLLLPALASARPLTLTIPKPDLFEPSTTGPFYEAALRLALSKTATPDETLEIRYYDTYVGRERLRVLVSKGEPDIMWSSSTPEREQQLEPVKFNLLKGINEYRYLLIREKDVYKYAGVKTLEDLRQFTVGAGVHWSDTIIFRDNDFKVMTSWSHYSLFRMLAAGRFDFMARAYNEITTELNLYPDYHLAREPHLVLHYPQPIYFFVSKENKALAERLQTGLQLAQLDGSYDKLFFSVPEYRAAWASLQQLDKRILYLGGIPSTPPARLKAPLMPAADF